MALIRRISIIEFKEIFVEIPSGQFEELRRGTDYTVVNGNFTGNGIPNRSEIGTYGLDDWGFRSTNGTKVFPDDLKDSNNDGIPDYLSLDVDNDGTYDVFGSQDFVGVIKKSYLLAKIRYNDSFDQTKTIREMYDSYMIGNYNPTSQFFDVEGWVVIGESKPSFYYERCMSTYGGNVYSGRIPVSLNYFDLDDFWIDFNQDGSTNLVAGDGINPLEIIGRTDFGNDRINPNNRRGGFDLSFGPSAEEHPFPLEIRWVHDYMGNVVNEFGIATFPKPIRQGQVNVAPNLATIKTKVAPVNLHLAARYHILSQNEFLNTKPFSKKLELNTVYYNTWHPNIPNDIEFHDGARDRWGEPRLAIERGFLITTEKSKGKCVIVPDEQVAPDIDETNQSRTRVSIRDVLSGKVKMDGTNYIRGAITAHFIYPFPSATTQDIVDMYHEYERIEKEGAIIDFGSEFSKTSFDPINFSEFSIRTGSSGQRITISPLSEEWKRYKTSDPLTYSREIRSVIYVQDETAGMELLGTEFYSNEGFVYQTDSGGFVVSAKFLKNINGFPGIPESPSQGKPFAQFKDVDMGEGKTLPTVEVFPPGTDGSISTDRERLERYGRPEFENYSAIFPIKTYWETDTGYVPERYHFKVGDFIEVYNLKVLDRWYAPRTCKIVNSEYRIIPNDVEDVMQFFEENGYIKDITLEELSSLQFKTYQSGPRSGEYFDRDDVVFEWQGFDYGESGEPVENIHQTEHCLVRVKNVGFTKLDSLYKVGTNMISQPGTKFPIISNDDGPNIINNDPSTESYGFKFESGKKYIIQDENKTETSLGNRWYKSYVYIPYATEMSENHLKIPGKNFDLKNQFYQEWLNKNYGISPSELNKQQLQMYKWPLDIIGIQKFQYPFDELGDKCYMIMPRSMADFGIDSTNYDIFVREIATVSKNASTSTGSKPPAGSGGGSGGVVGGQDIENSTCFPAYVKVMTPSGYKEISKINVGELVVTFDKDLNLYERKVIRKYIHADEEKSDVYRYFMSNGKTMDITDNHPVLTNNGFIQIGKLKIGDSVLNYKNEEVFIVSKDFLFNDVVYNLEVDEHNAYIAEDMCVHNLTKSSNFDKLSTMLDELIETSKKVREGFLDGTGRP